MTTVIRTQHSVSQPSSGAFRPRRTISFSRTRPSLNMAAARRVIADAAAFQSAPSPRDQAMGVGTASASVHWIDR